MKSHQELANVFYTGCPIDMLTNSDSILKFLKSNMSKSKTYFEILGKKALDDTLKSGKIKLEVFLN